MQRDCLFAYGPRVQRRRRQRRHAVLRWSPLSWFATKGHRPKKAGVGEVDGNEFGEGEAGLYAYGKGAEALFTVMEPTLRRLPFRPAHVVLRQESREWSPEWTVSCTAAKYSNHGNREWLATTIEDRRTSILTRFGRPAESSGRRRLRGRVQSPLRSWDPPGSGISAWPSPLATAFLWEDAEPAHTEMKSRDRH